MREALQRPFVSLAWRTRFESHDSLFERSESFSNVSIRRLQPVQVCEIAAREALQPSQNFGLHARMASTVSAFAAATIPRICSRSFESSGIGASVAQAAPQLPPSWPSSNLLTGPEYCSAETWDRYSPDLPASERHPHGDGRGDLHDACRTLPFAALAPKEAVRSWRSFGIP